MSLSMANPIASSGSIMDELRLSHNTRQNRPESLFDREHGYPLDKATKAPVNLDQHRGYLALAAELSVPA